MKNNSLKVLFISNGIFVFANHLLGPLYAIFVEKFDVNVVSISSSWAIYMLSATVFTLLIRKIGDKVIEHEYMLIAGYVIRIICWIGYIFVGSFQLFLVIQVLLGISEAVASPAFDTIFAKHLDKDKEVSEYATWKLYENGALALSTFVGGIIVQYSNFETLFVLMSLLALFPIFYIIRQDRSLL